MTECGNPWPNWVNVKTLEYDRMGNPWPKQVNVKTLSFFVQDTPKIVCDSF